MDITQNQLLNSSSEESPEVSYCREITTIRTNLATDESIIAQVNIKAKLQSLLAAHAKIDAKTATTEKRIKLTQAEAETLNRNQFNAKQFENRSLARLESTGERVDVVEEKTKRIKNRATDIKKQQDNVIKKLKENAEQTHKCEEYEKQIATLEEKIKESTDAPEPEFNSKLVEENNNFKEKINHYKEQSKLKQIKAQKLRELKNEKTELLRQIQEKQKGNNLLTRQLDNKKNYLNEKETAVRTKFQQLREKISEKSDVLHQLQQDFQETNQHSTSLKSKVDELKSTIADKETQFQNMRDNLTIQMHTLCEEKVTKQKQQNLDSAKLKQLENELQDALRDNEIKLKAVMEKSNQLYQLKEEKEKLMGKIYIQKNLATTHQHELTDERNKLDAISEKYTVEQMQVTMLKNKHQTLTENIHKIKTELDTLFVQEKEARQTLELEFSGKIHDLQKEIDLKNANINILMDCELEPAQKKIDELKQEINGIEQRKRAEEIHYKMLIQTSERMKKEVKTDKLFVLPKPVSASVQNTSLVEAENDDSQPASGRKLSGIVKTPLKSQQVETPKALTSHRSGSSIADNRTKKVNASVRNTSLVEAANENSQPGTSRKSPGNVKSPIIPKPVATVKKANTPVIEDLVEAETEDTRGSSGRRSPGILKLPLLKPQNVQTSKRVTFHGVPSSESSSTSVVDDGSQKDLDEVLKAWSKFSSTKRNLDF